MRRRLLATPLPRALLALFLVALAARLALVLATPNYTPVPPFDAWDYDRHATSIAAGHGYPVATLAPTSHSPTAFRPPLFPYMLAATYKLAPGTLDAGRSLDALLGAASVLLVFLIVDRLWGRRPAWAAGALAAVFPPLIGLSGALTVESLFIPLELGLVLALLAYVRSGELRWALLGGLLVGLAALARQNGFVLAIPLLLGLLAGRPRPEVRTLAVAAGGALLVAAVVVAPWIVRNVSVFDRLTPISTSVGYALNGTYSDVARKDKEKGAWRPPERNPANLDLYLHRDWDEADVDHELATRALDYMAHHPGYAAEATLLNAWRMLNPRALPDRTTLSYEAMGTPRPLRRVVTGSYFAVALLALAGLALLIRRREIGPLWFWSVPVLLGFSFATLNAEPRYRTMIDPFTVMMAGIALAAIADRVRSRRQA